MTGDTRKPLPSKPIRSDRELEGALQALISRYGQKAVRQTAERLCKARPGPKAKRDWELLADDMRHDALDWLEGRDPMKLRSNYAIASRFADAHPGQSRPSTFRRIMGKLAKDRRRTFLFVAWRESADNRPFADHFRASKALAEHDQALAEIVLSMGDSHRGRLERYREHFGEPPAEMSIREIEDALLRPEVWMKARTSPTPRIRGLLAELTPPDDAIQPE